MSLSKYNRALDFTSLAIAKFRAGDAVMAAKLFAQAATAPDAVRAVQIIEASNGQAFATILAATKKPVKAAATQVKAEFDMGDDADIDSLLGDDSGTADMADVSDVGADMPPADDGAEELGANDMGLDGDDADGDEDFDAQFAKVLGSMKRAQVQGSKKPVAATKAPAPASKKR